MNRDEQRIAASFAALNRQKSHERAIPSQLSDAIRYHQQLIRQSNMATTNATSQSSAAPHVAPGPNQALTMEQRLDKQYQMQQQVQYEQRLKKNPSYGRQSDPAVEVARKRLQMQEKQAQLKEKELLGEDADDLEEAELANSYNSYKSIKFNLGLPHPDELIESVSLAACIPPDATYKLHLPRDMIESGLLSSPQLESVTYACQSHEKLLANGERQGFFLGDGAGVGKGRQLSGMIMENWMLGRKKHIWLSMAADLHVDAQRDLKDIGADDITPVLLGSLSYKTIPITEGVIFATYSTLTSSSKGNDGRNKRIRRIDQLIKWCGEDFDGCILFDECHKAKNLIPTRGQRQPTKIGLAVEELQKKLPLARIVYCSATGVTEPSNMAYMSRLGLWGPGTIFSGFTEFHRATIQGGIGMMELVAMHLKRQGLFVCRTLSFQGCNFNIVEEAVSDEQLAIYDQATELWIELHQQLQRGINGEMLKWFPVKKARKQRRRSKDMDSDEEEDEDEDLDDLSDEEEDEDDDEDLSELNPHEAPLKIPRKNPTQFLMRYFWNCHQRFFRGLCISLKIPHAVDLARKAIQDHHAVVIGLQSTGETGAESEMTAISRQNNSDVENLNDFISSPAAALKKIIFKLFPLPPHPLAINEARNEVKKETKPLKRSAAIEASSRIKNTWKKPIYVDEDEESVESKEESLIDSDESTSEDSSDDSIDSSVISNPKTDQEIKKGPHIASSHRIIDEEDDLDDIHQSMKSNVVMVDDEEELCDGEIEPLMIQDILHVDLSLDDEEEPMITLHDAKDNKLTEKNETIIAQTKTNDSEGITSNGDHLNDSKDFPKVSYGSNIFEGIIDLSEMESEKTKDREQSSKRKELMTISDERSSKKTKTNDEMSSIKIETHDSPKDRVNPFPAPTMRDGDEGMRTQINTWNIYEEEGWLIGDERDEKQPHYNCSEKIRGQAFKHYLGRRISKKFGRKWVDATIVAYLPASVNDGEELWHVLYTDGDEEDLGRKEMLRLLIPDNSKAESIFQVKSSSNSVITLSSSSGASIASIHKKSTANPTGEVALEDFEEKKSIPMKSIPKDSRPKQDTQPKAADYSFLDEINQISTVSDRIYDTKPLALPVKNSSVKNTTNASVPSLLHALEALEKDLLIVKAERDRKPYLTSLVTYIQALEYRINILKRIHSIDLPRNPLDVLIDELGGPDEVAEMTGRKSRIIRDPKTNTLIYARRSYSNGVSMDKQNLYERDMFMNGKKRIAIISDAASSGISLHADYRVKNQFRRVHITLELPWSADRAIQQLGRSHRSNQSSAPAYHLLISPQGGERRFAAAVAKRLESLGALTQGDRKATVGAKAISLAEFNLDTKYGRRAMNVFSGYLLQSVDAEGLPKLLPRIHKFVAKDVQAYEQKYNGGPSKSSEDTQITTKSFLAVARLKLQQVGLYQTGNTSSNPFESVHVPKFLNRILGLSSAWQRVLFDLFFNILEELIRAAKREQSFDAGIMEVPGGKKKQILVPPQIVWRNIRSQNGSIEYPQPNEKGIGDQSIAQEDVVLHYTISVDRTMPWEDAINTYVQALKQKQIIANKDSHSGLQYVQKKGGIVDGFYTLRYPLPHRQHIVLALEKQGSVGLSSNVSIFRPTTGANEMNRNEFRDKYKQMDVKAAVSLTDNLKVEIFDSFDEISALKELDESLAKTMWKHQYDENRDRFTRNYHLLTGSVLHVWGIISKIYDNYNHSLMEGEKKFTMRIARATIPPQSVSYSDKVIDLTKDQKDIKSESHADDKKGNVIFDLIESDTSSSSVKFITKKGNDDEGLSLIGLYIIDTRIEEVVRQLQVSQEKGNIVGQKDAYLAAIMDTD